MLVKVLGSCIGVPVLGEDLDTQELLHWEESAVRTSDVSEPFSLMTMAPRTAKQQVRFFAFLLSRLCLSSEPAERNSWSVQYSSRKKLLFYSIFPSSFHFFNELFRFTFGVITGSSCEVSVLVLFVVTSCCRLDGGLIILRRGGY